MRYHVSLDQAKDLFDRFDIEEHIDSGGQKDVFKGSYNGKPVVVKTLVVNSFQATKRAEREVEVMEQADSDILVDLIYAYPEKVDGNELFVMVEEFIPGKTLREYIDEDGPSLDLGLTTAKNILEVLVEFYQNSWVHRDIKPQNIMITPDGDVRLLDVGIVRMLNEEGLTPTYNDRAPGTPGYSAPEQINNNKAKQGTRTDLFSTGIVMYESTTGQHPFKGHDMTVEEAVMTGEYSKIEIDVNSAASDELQYFFDKTLVPTINQRFRKPELAIDSLERIEEAL